jgi:GT2 family glycosyltransferase
MTSVLALLTVHNRRELTGRCLASLRDAARAAGLSLSIVVVDDGSTDGTTDMLRRDLSAHDRLVVGDGNLYWAGGMRRAMEEGLSITADFVLLLNDDTQLFSDGLTTMVNEARSAISVGAVCDPATGLVTYGGLRSKSWARPLTFEPVPLGAEAEAMNANAVLVPYSVFRVLGAFDRNYTHGLADYDYALSARRAGVSVRVTSKVVGECSRNSSVGTWLEPGASFRTRWLRLLEPKGLPPREWAHFCLKNAGVMGLPYLVSPLARIVIGPK